MNKLFYILLVLLGFSSCSNGQELKVSVKNTTEIERNLETVEVCWKQLTAKLPAITPEEVVVFDQSGKEIPSQVIFKGGQEPLSLIFQGSVQPNAEKVYTVKKGVRSTYPQQAYGRFVPERKDDYAWENNLVGHRMYGPALQATGEISNGIDTWVKCTDQLLIDEWYKSGDYHKNYGKGMDCYKVGRTLGSGAMAPYINDTLVLGKNYIQQQTLDNGPLRISFRLDYAPFKAGDGEVTETRIITLDANTHFNRIEEIYAQSSENMPVAAGIVLRKQQGETLMGATEGVAAYWEPQNTDNGDDNGHTAIAMVFPQSLTDVLDAHGHLLALTTYAKAGEPLVYYLGTAWSLAKVPTAEAWFKMVKEQSVKVKKPLQITLL